MNTNAPQIAQPRVAEWDGKGVRPANAPKIEGIRAAYSSADKARCAERLRHHIWSPKMPHRRIIRPYRCCYCRATVEQLGEMPQAHHPDYSRPFLVSWLCTSCHRRVEAGSITLRARHLFDYASLVNAEPGRWRRGQRGPQSRSQVGRRRKTVLEEVPF